ncbi:hypothetical protein HIK39_004822 [Shigella dysenteriae]|jgi:hypothetical protein|nr:hypothetical protein [Shigella dysenteriae]EFP8428650.1 hypothetical protein [Shigella dysenteriae]EGO3793726.1 hypothetical protein [Escherichia coli]EKG0944592.1 hypothetical protein [Shigella dysenteriae]ELP0584559.1 hypothetical protein [Escherichia coli]
MYAKHRDSNVYYHARVSSAEFRFLFRILANGSWQEILQGNGSFAPKSMLYLIESGFIPHVSGAAIGLY